MFFFLASALWNYKYEACDLGLGLDFGGSFVSCLGVLSFVSFLTCLGDEAFRWLRLYLTTCCRMCQPAATTKVKVKHVVC